MRAKINLLFILFGLITILLSCNLNQKNREREELVRDYYNGFNTGDYGLISNTVCDSIKITEKEYILTRTRNELQRQFQWDSVFSPKYSLVDLKIKGNSAEVTISKICKRIAFLQDSALVYNVLIDFDGDKISEIQTTEYVFLDFLKWRPRRDNLTNWINENHPELAGFVSTQSVEGAQNYLIAIDLYKTEK
ncbi:MAG: hypothetical protein WC951_12160 [Bacteroidales bacterium]